MALDITEHFEYSEKLGCFDFTLEDKRIRELRALPSSRTVLVGNTPLTIIAYREYGDHTLWWILATYNFIIEVDDFPHKELEIPALRDVQRVLK